MASESGKYNDERLENHIGSLSSTKHTFGASSLEKRIAALEERVAALESPKDEPADPHANDADETPAAD